MNWFVEYKKSLKNIHAEEALDIYLYRPFAFVIVKLLYQFPITPNQYSLAAFISGALSAICFYQGTIGYLKLGSFFFFLFAVLDCCDGMVARLKKNGSEFGRLIDGFVDYSVNAMVYISLILSANKWYHSELMAPWIIILLAGISKIIHSMAFDHYLAEFLAYEKGDFGFTNQELEKYREKLNLAQKNNEHTKTFFLKLYIGYTAVQAASDLKVIKYEPKDYCDKNISSLKLWGIIGPTGHISILIIAFLMNWPNLFIIYSVVLGNIWAAIMYFNQLNINSKLKLDKTT